MLASDHAHLLEQGLCDALPRARALALLLGTAAADQLVVSPVLFPSEGAVLRAGTEVDLRWERMPEEVEELELLLRIDDGSGLTVRLTEQLRPTGATFRWMVPNIPAAGARIVVRVSRGRGEEELAAGPRFTILGDQTAPVEPFTLSDGELWTRREGVRSLPPRPPGPASPNRIAAQSAPADVAEAPGPSQVQPQRVTTALLPAPGVRPRSGAPVTACLRQPVSFPLRP